MRRQRLGSIIAQAHAEGDAQRNKDLGEWILELGEVVGQLKADEAVDEAPQWGGDNFGFRRRAPP